ncbi:MAG: restriction endonuclease [Opitutae bacterium]|nr:restriction endonuclease [Opitutae bacterium]
MHPPLTLAALQREAALFATWQSGRNEASLYGVTDGKAVGTHLEHAFQGRLHRRYTFPAGNSARGIDFPGLAVDLKVTSARQPQSSCPFKDARQKIYGLGYSLLVFVYEKHDVRRSRAARLEIQHAVFVAKECTGDFQTTSGLRRLLENQANRDDLLAYFAERMLPVSDILADALADEILRTPPPLGYLTISNALQWRLQYSRIIEQAGHVDGIQRLGT